MEKFVIILLKLVINFLDFLENTYQKAGNIKGDENNGKLIPVLLIK